MTQNTFNERSSSNQLPVSKPLPTVWPNVGHNRHLHNLSIYKKVKVKVTFTLEQATEAQRESTGIALLFL